MNERGHFDLVIKVYFPNDEFPSGGLMSQQMDSLNIGDEMDFSAPYGTIEYRSDLDQFTVPGGRKLTGFPVDLQRILTCFYRAETYWFISSWNWNHSNVATYSRNLQQREVSKFIF